MAGDNRRHLGADATGFAGDCRLDGSVRRDVDDQPAHGAGQVMVVLPAQRLAQLEAIVVARTGHPLQHADALEHDEVAIQRALRDAGAVVIEQIGHGDRAPGSGDEVEDGPALLGVALPDAAETALSGRVQIVVSRTVVVRRVPRHPGHRTFA